VRMGDGLNWLRVVSNDELCFPDVSVRVVLRKIVFAVVVLLCFITFYS
jgi:hypothetical protein